MKPFTAFAFLVLCTINLAVGEICAGSDFFPDQRGCCPLVVGSTPFYADAQGCFPRFIGGVAFYADAQGCFPNSAVPTHTCEWYLHEGAITNRAYRGCTGALARSARPTACACPSARTSQARSSRAERACAPTASSAM